MLVYDDYFDMLVRSLQTKLADQLTDGGSMTKPNDLVTEYLYKAYKYGKEYGWVHDRESDQRKAVEEYIKQQQEVG